MTSTTTQRAHHPRTLWRAGLAVLAALIAVAPTPAPARAADPPAVEAARELAALHGGSPNDYELIHEGAAPDAEVVTWSGKFLDLRTGEVRSAYRSPDGRIGGERLLEDRVGAVESGRTALEAKADRPLRAAVQGERPTASVPVAVWLDADTEAAEAAVRARHPGARWLAGRPTGDDLDVLRALRAELWAARRDVYAAAADELRAEVEAAGGTVAYVSTSAPLVFVDLPAGAVERVSRRPDVRSMGLEGEWEEQMSSAGRAVRANWTSGAGDQGSGVRVAVVEYHNVSTGGDLSGQVVRSYSTSGTLAYGSGAVHPTWVAGAIASRSGTYPGTAPGSDIVSASTGGYSPSVATDRAIIAAADWSIAASGGDADIVNASIGQDTVTGAEEARRYFDSVGWEDGRLVVAAAGNFSTFGHWDILSPGTGYNVLTVGGIDDRNTAGWGDDRIWYRPGTDGSNYRDRSDAAWNQHGDYNKPNLVAPAVSVRTANGTYGDGTSVATPVVSGIAAQLIARAPALATWPEATRAILMAGALRSTPMADGSRSRDREGVGTADATWSNRLLSDSQFGGYRIGSMTGSPVVQDISVVKGQRIRVALAWSSHTSGTSNTGKSDVLRSDLDLRVVGPDGAVRWSATFDNSYESVDIVAGQTGTLRVEIRPTRFDAAEEPYGLAWAKSGPFFDADDSPFRSSIIWAYRAGITGGCGPSRYCPTSSVTREQMAAFLRRAANLPLSSVDAFVDDDGRLHEDDINALAAARVTGGCGPERFCPTVRVSRGQMASFLVRVLDLPRSATDAFDDDDGSLHEDDINALAAASISGGCAPRAFCPSRPVSRGEMAAFLQRGFGP